MINRLLGAGLAVIALAILQPAGGLTAQSRAADNQPPLQVLGLRGPTGVALAELVVGTPYTIEGRAVSYAVVPTVDVALARFVSGEAPIAMLPTNVAAQLRGRGVAARIAAVSHWGVLYLLSSDAAVRDIASLRGRTLFAVARGATPDIVLRYLLQEAGLNAERDLTLDYRFGPAELAQYVAGGGGQTVVLPEPFVTQVLARRPDMRVVIDFQREWQARFGTMYPQTAIVVREDLYRAAPRLFDGVLSQIRAAMDRSTANPALAAEHVRRSQIGVPPEIVADALPRLNARYVGVQDAAAPILDYLRVLYQFDPRSVGGSLPGRELLLE